MKNDLQKNNKKMYDENNNNKKVNDVGAMTEKARRTFIISNP